MAASSLLLISKTIDLAVIRSTLSRMYFFRRLHTGASKRNRNRLAKTKVRIVEERSSLTKFEKVYLNVCVGELSPKKKYMN